MAQDWSNNISYNPATYAPQQVGSRYQGFNDFSGDRPPKQLTKATRSFAGPGGTFSQLVPENAGEIDWRTGQIIPMGGTGLGGDWQTSTGQRISDLGGYLGMKDQQKQGSDSSQYLNQLQGLMNDPSKIQQTAGYQFAIDQGNQAINRSAASKGMLNSGNVLAELAKYGQGMASQEYGNQVNRLSGLAKNAQNFGLESGYYTPETYSPHMGFGKR